MANHLIIGASSGIGAALARTLLAEGHRVYGTFNRHPDGVPQGVSSQAFRIPEDENLPSSFLPDVIDGFVYCPGSIQLKPFHRLTSEEFARDYELNVGAVVRLLQQVMPQLKRSANASLVFFSTVAVQQGLPFHTLVSASKGALEGLTRALAAEWAPSIRVNCIAPSLTRTPLAAQLLSSPEKITAGAQRHPLKRIGQPEDMAAMAAFLLSGSASWVTGQIFHVDGGLSALRV